MYIDIFILVLLLWAAFCGYRNGFLRELVSTAGVVIGLLVAATCYDKLGEYLCVDGTEVNAVTSVVAFLLLWIIVPIALGFAATILTKALQFVCMGFVNSLLGVVVSAAKYVLLLSCVLNAMQSLNILNTERTEGSYLFEPVTGFLNTAFEKVIKPTYYEVIEPTVSDTLWVDFTQKTDL